jgi:Zn-dependent peptidase ImmA (M78 family)
MDFRPHELQYDPHGVPILKFTRIEEIAAELLRKRCNHVLQKGCPTPVLDILEKLREKTKLNYEMADLGTVDGKKVLGKVNFPSRTLFLDKCLLDERSIQFRFTAAHEIGHWVLHRYRPLRINEQGPVEEFTDDEDSLCRLESTTSREWVERQANAFAAALVLPIATFRAELVSAQREIGITKNLGVAFLNNDPSSKGDLGHIVAMLSDKYNVSKESVKVRLRTQQLLLGESVETGRSVREIMKRGVL